MGMWVSVNDKDSLAPVTNASFSVWWHNNGNGNYWVGIGQNQRFWVDSPNHKVQYAYSDGYDHIQVSLTKDTWP